MKSVLISIQPKWCELIASGKKTVEVRKTKPKLETPFKVYIYCTANKQGTKDLLEIHGTDGKIRKANGKVIGEFVCDAIFPMSIKYSNPESKLALKEFPFTCLTDKQIIDYLGNGKEGYGWHILNLIIYDKPKELSEFHKPTMPTGLRYENDVITRPPQSWCYVESKE